MIDPQINVRSSLVAHEHKGIDECIVEGGEETNARRRKVAPKVSYRCYMVCNNNLRESGTLGTYRFRCHIVIVRAPINKSENQTQRQP